MFRFASPWLFTLVPIVLMIAWNLARRRRRADARLMLPGALARLRVGRSPWQMLEGALPWMRGLVLLLLLLALARPQAGSKLETVSTYGVDIMIGLSSSVSARAVIRCSGLLMSSDSA